jgi:2,5-furandicarboxylate decarboxylase 1
MIVPAIATFRDLLSRLDDNGPLRRITRPVDPRFELIAVTRLVQKAGNEPLLFANVVGSSQPVAGNVLGRRQSLADALGQDTRTLVPWLANQTGGLAPEVVDAAPVQEVVVTRDIDVAREIPQVVHSERDAGAYISAGVCIGANPDDGVINASWNRIQIVGDNHARIRMMPPQHLGQYQALAEQRHAPLPVAVAIGAPPSLMLSAASKIPYEADEYEVAGAWAGAPLRVTKGARCRCSCPLTPK